jgi:prephenate dehydrogenase
VKQFERAVIVGVGLLGGSIGLALRNRKLAKRVVGFSPRGSSLDAAVARGAIDASSQTIQEACQGSDLVIVCTPVQSVAEQVQQCARHMAPNGWITDVGSTKEKIVTSIAATAAIDQFIGSHPLAGSEKSGVDFARENLLEKKLVVVTPHTIHSSKTARQTELAVLAEQLWKSLGARTMRMNPQDHDAAVARTSHLPHILASALAAATPDSVLPLAASGWCDTTRVASGGVELWRQIIDENRTPIVDALEEFSTTLQLWLTALRNEDGPTIEQLLTDGKKKRDSLGN